MFVDQVKVNFQAGNGGDGAVSFRHEKFVDRGGPDGGDGGHGGDIILKASRNQNTLASFRYKKSLKAENGQPGGKSRKHGRSGKHLQVDVPIGTVVNDENGQTLADLVSDGQSAIIAHGGKGGFGNAHFTSSTRQAPRVAEKGEDGQALEAQLELKMIADVGLVGLPNAGKSTFLSVVSNARPEIADYPFTTLRPNLGVVDIDGTSILLADIPGLIKGASQGKGLGDEFLRHVERTKLLLHLIDIHNPDIGQAYRTIIDELKNYKIDLSKKPQLVVLTKVDGLDKATIGKAMQALKKATPRTTKITAISSISGEGVKDLLRQVRAETDKLHRRSARKSIQERLPVIRLRPSDSGWTVTKEGKHYIVSGEPIERFARRTKFGDFYAEQRLRDIMRRAGINQELQKLGAISGDKIRIGSPVIGEVRY